MKRLVSLLICSVLILHPMAAVNAEELRVMNLTYYSPESCPGTITASGQEVRYGIAAVTREHYGDCAVMYTIDGRFLGYFECVDIIGTGKSSVIDIWVENNRKGQNIISTVGTKVLVKWIDNPQG